MLDLFDFLIWRGFIQGSIIAEQIHPFVRIDETIKAAELRDHISLYCKYSCANYCSARRDYKCEVALSELRFFPLANLLGLSHCAHMYTHYHDGPRARVPRVARPWEREKEGCSLAAVVVLARGADECSGTVTIMPTLWDYRRRVLPARADLQGSSGVALLFHRHPLELPVSGIRDGRRERL